MSGASEEADPTVAGLLSFIIPGLGHIISNDQTRRGAIVLVIAIIADIVIFLVSGLLTVILIGFFGFLLIPVVHIVAAYDGYNQANKINAGEVIVE